MNIFWLFSLFILVPFLIHLFDFRKAKKFYFSSIKYISSLSTKSKNQSRLKYFLILTNRVLLFVTIIASILTFTTRDSNTNHPLAIYYDNSFSSEIGDGVEIVKRILTEVAQKGSNGYFFSNNERVALSDEFILDLLHIGTTANSMNLSNLERGDITAKEYFIISDLQQLDIDQALSLVADTANTFNFYLLDYLNSSSNVSVDSLLISPNPSDLSRLSISIRFSVFNMESGSIVVKLFQGNRQLSSLAKNVSDLDEVNFDIPIDGFGNYQVVFEGDEVAYDNIFHFTVGERKKPNIVIFNTNEDKDYIGTAYKNDELFDMHLQSLNSVDYELLKDADLIVFNGLEKLPTSLMKQFPETNYLIFPSINSNSENYQEFLKLRLILIEGEKYEIALEEQNPLLRGIFNAKIGKGLMPSLPQVFTVKGSFEPIIRFRNGNPFLLKTNNKFFFNSALIEENTFQSNALFLPLLYQIAFSSSHGFENSYFFPSDRVSLELKYSESPIKIANDNSELIPEFNINSEEIIIEIPANIEPGIYQLLQGDSILNDIAINVPKSESIMHSPTIDELNSIFADYRNVQIHSVNSDINEFLLSSSTEVSLWKYALILVLMFIFSETMLHRYLK
ncbi:BatA domain-containing protein [Ekhidna sp.]|uniref:BatA domain-containing protein n=1 Tax=Ekhidna sp. TaxID=2608089 RepID=UPI003BAA101F